MFVVLAVLAMALALVSQAAPAWDAEQLYTQPGGGTFRGTLCGDEFLHYVKAGDGALLTKGEDGVWLYAGTDARYLLDTPAAPSDQAKWLAEQAAAAPDYGAFPPDPPSGGEIAAQEVAGDQAMLVLLVDFQDVTVQYEASWAGLVFGGGNSVSRYYSDATGGKIKVVPVSESYTGKGAANDGVVRVSLLYNHPNPADTGSSSNRRIAADAFKAAAGYVDLASFDKNSDRKITRDELKLLIVCAGYEEAYDGSSPSVWGHHRTGANIAIGGGKVVDSCMMVGEIHGDHLATIGILCHELGHGFGLPDLYSNGESEGLGGFSLMSRGNWGRRSGQYAGASPVFPDAYCLEQLGVFPVQALLPGERFDGMLRSVSTGKKNILRLSVPDSDEYFLIENRQIEMYDEAMQWFGTYTGGAAVYRVNPAFNNNYVDGKPLVTLLEADEAVRGRPGLTNGRLYNIEPFFHADNQDGTLFNDTLNRLTTPSARLQGGGSGWFHFACRGKTDVDMAVEVHPIITASPQSITLDYRSGKGKIEVASAVGSVRFTSGNTALVGVDGSGNVVPAKGAKGTATVTVADDSEFTDTVAVTVRYAWWQWLIVVALFGWAWY